MKDRKEEKTGDNIVSLKNDTVIQKLGNVELKCDALYSTLQ